MADALAASATLSGNFMLDVATLYAVAFCGPILFWLPGSTEILSAAFGRAGFSPLVVGATCASGQCTLFALLYIFGMRLTARWGWLKRSVDAVAYGKGRKYFERGKIAMAVGAGIAGLPPTVPLFTLGPSLQMKLSLPSASCVSRPAAFSAASALRTASAGGPHYIVRSQKGPSGGRARSLATRALSTRNCRLPTCDETAPTRSPRISDLAIRSETSSRNSAETC